MRYEVLSDMRVLGTCVQAVGCSADSRITHYDGRRDTLILHYVMGGKGFYNGNSVEAGYGFIIRPGQCAKYYADACDPWSFYWFTIDTADPDSILRHMREEETTHTFPYGFAQEMRGMAEELMAENRRFDAGMHNAQLLLRVLEYHVRENTRQTPVSAAKQYAQSARQFLHLHYAERIAIEDVARYAGVSASYLYRSFVAEYGVSPKRYLSDLRIRAAKQYLARKDMTIGEVGRAVGYEDVLEFSRFFRANVGVSPRAFRE